jgi:hypothetical protein
VKLLVSLALVAWAAPATAEPLFDRVLERPLPVVIESLRMRYTHFEQTGRGWQSQAGGLEEPGSEAAVIEQPQIEMVAKQGQKLTHRIWAPFDVVTAASPDAVDATKDGAGRIVDAVSTASRVNEAGGLEIFSTYQLDPKSTLSVRSGFHLEEHFRSFTLGGGGTRSFADDNAVLGISLNQVLDWFDRYDHKGNRLARVFRSSTNLNLGLTQLLSPTTIVTVNYGLTVQSGELGNTWNAVPLVGRMYGGEILPHMRQRHAFVGRLAQWLPWKGAMKYFYRFYVDDWGLQAHTAEVELYQRLTSWLYLRGNYRYHWQSGVDFYTERGSTSNFLRTADSDLSRFSAQTVGILAAVDVRFVKRLRDLHLDFGYERYFRTNSLTANIYTCSVGFRF